MSWPITMLADDLFKVMYKNHTLTVGTATYISADVLQWPWVYLTKLSTNYLRFNQSRRPPVAILMPGYWLFSPDCVEHGGNEGWLVHGEMPKITVAPSIHAQGIYHGHIQDGMILDDVDGKKYDGVGRLINAT